MIPHCRITQIAYRTVLFKSQWYPGSGVLAALCPSDTGTGLQTERQLNSQFSGESAELQYLVHTGDEERQPDSCYNRCTLLVTESLQHTLNTLLETINEGRRFKLCFLKLEIFCSETELKLQLCSILKENQSVLKDTFRKKGAQSFVTF